MATKCKVCGVIYQHYQSLNRHMKTTHPTEYAQSVSSTRHNLRSLLCTVCSGQFKSRCNFVKHLSADHDVRDSVVTEQFESLEQFRAWKIEMEESTYAFFTNAGTTMHNGYKVLNFKCNRSGFYVPQGKGLRPLKTKGTRKMNGYCPSGLKVKVEIGEKCTVTHYNTHWGHEMDLQHLSFTTDERKRIKFDGKPTKRLDNGPFPVMRIPHNKACGRITTMNKGKITSKLELLISRHKISVTMDREKVSQNGDAWIVPSLDGKDMYTVSVGKEKCSCKLICDKCDACIHRYVCTCLDSAKSNNMCEHTHLVLMKIRSMKTPITGEDFLRDDPDDEPPCTTSQ